MTDKAWVCRGMISSLELKRRRVNPLAQQTRSHETGGMRVLPVREAPKRSPRAKRLSRTFAYLSGCIPTPRMARPFLANIAPVVIDWAMSVIPSVPTWPQSRIAHLRRC